MKCLADKCLLFMIFLDTFAIRWHFPKVHSLPKGLSSLLRWQSRSRICAWFPPRNEGTGETSLPAKASSPQTRSFFNYRTSKKFPYKTVQKLSLLIQINHQNLEVFIDFKAAFVEWFDSPKKNILLLHLVVLVSQSFLEILPEGDIQYLNHF